MKNKFVTSLVATAAIVGLTATVQAIPVTGTIQITGNVDLNSTHLSTATTASFPGSPDGSVVSGTSSYSAAGVAGAAVTFSDFSFASTGPQVIAPLWTFHNSVNGFDYSFNLASITSVTHIADTDILIKGLGTVSITGIGSTFDLTFANWSFNVTDTSGGGNSTFNFAFNDSNTAFPSVPDGGTTVVLLGAALSGLAWVNARRNK